MPRSKLRPPLPEPGEEVVQQSLEAVTRNPEDRRRGCFRYLSQQLITFLEYRQSRVLNAMDDLVNVVISMIVDASVHAFTTQTVTLVFASCGLCAALPLKAAFGNGTTGETIRTKAYASCYLVVLMVIVISMLRAH